MRFETSVVVKRPIEEVWAFLTDVFNLPRISKPALGLRQTSPGPIGVGTVYEGRAVLFGLERRIAAVVTEWDPPHAYAMSTRGAGLGSGSLRIALEATPEGTSVVRVGEFQLRGIWKLLWAIVGPFMRRQVHAESQTLKRVLENGRGQSPEDRIDAP